MLTQKYRFSSRSTLFFIVFDAVPFRYSVLQNVWLALVKLFLRIVFYRCEANLRAVPRDAVR